MGKDVDVRLYRQIDKQKELYSLTYIDETDKADKDTTEEDAEI